MFESNLELETSLREKRKLEESLSQLEKERRKAFDRFIQKAYQWVHIRPKPDDLRAYRWENDFELYSMGQKKILDFNSQPFIFSLDICPTDLRIYLLKFKTSMFGKKIPISAIEVFRAGNTSVYINPDYTIDFESIYNQICNEIHEHTEKEIRKLDEALALEVLWNPGGK